MQLKTFINTTLFATIFIVQPLMAQHKWEDCSQPFLSPDGNYSLTCSEKPGENEACLITTLSLKGKGIADSIIVSQTATFDCQRPQFYWSRNEPLLVIETNYYNAGCDGARITQVFDLEQKKLLYATDGQLYLFDYRQNKAILYHGKADRDAYGNVTKFWFNLHVYNIATNQKFPICSLETYYVDCKGDFELKFDESSPGTVKINFLENQNRMARSEFLIRY